jgi:hypothetical protein
MTINTWDDTRKSPLESVKQAIGKVLIDFHKWAMPDTKAFDYWKKLEVRNAIVVAPSRMIDDIDTMLSKYRQQETDKGFVAPLPVMIIALDNMVSPPEISAIKGVPYWLNTMVPTDPLNRPIKLRTVARQYRVQLAFVCAEGDTSQSVINQFCTYMQDDFKRRFMATYDLGGGVTDDWELTVIENSLYPDKVPTGQSNMAVNTVDFQVAGLLPQVVGLRNEDGSEDYGEGVDLDGRDPVDTPEGDTQEWSVIVEADLYSPADQTSVMRAKADKETGERTIERVKI